MAILYTGNGGHVEGAGSGGTIAVTLTGVVASDGIVGSVTFDTTATTTVSVSDGTTTANADKQRNSTNLGQANAAWSIPNSPSGSRTFTATFGASSLSRGIQAMEFSGLPTAAGSFVTGTPGSNDSGAGTATAFDNTTTTTPGVAGALIFEIGEYQTQQPVVGGSFNLLENDASNDVTTGYFVQGSAAAVSPSFTGTAAQIWAVVIVAYAPAAAASSVPYRAWPQPADKRVGMPDLIPLPAVQKTQGGLPTSRFLVPTPQPLDKKVAAPDLIPLPAVQVSRGGLPTSRFLVPTPQPLDKKVAYPDLIPIVLAKVNVGTAPVSAAPPFVPIPVLLARIAELIGLPPVMLSEAGQAASVAPLTPTPKPLYKAPDLIPPPAVQTSQAGQPANVAPLTPTPLPLFKAPDLIPLPAVQVSEAGQPANVAPLTPTPEVVYRAPDLIPLPAVQTSQAGQPANVAPLTPTPRPLATPIDRVVSWFVQIFTGIPAPTTVPPFVPPPVPQSRPVELVPQPPVQLSQAGQPATVAPFMTVPVLRQVDVPAVISRTVPTIPPVIAAIPFAPLRAVVYRAYDLIPVVLARVLQATGPVAFTLGYWINRELRDLGQLTQQLIFPWPEVDIDMDSANDFRTVPWGATQRRTLLYPEP